MHISRYAISYIRKYTAYTEYIQYTLCYEIKRNLSLPFQDAMNQRHKPQMTEYRKSEKND